MPAHEFADTAAAPVSQPADPASLQVNYYVGDPASPAPPLLAALHFGVSADAAVSSGLDVAVQLEPLCGSPHIEGWIASGPVTTGSAGEIRYAMDDHRLFAVMEVDEAACGGVRAAAAEVYATALRFQAESGFPHLLRMWNYLDAINEGPGDLERYREFCVGRAHGLGAAMGERFPAASAIGRQTRTGRLQVFWLAGRTPGAPFENPRQVSAWRYPRTYGPVGPSFSRATLAPGGALLISGTASIVGHLSHHHGDPHAQLEETLRNLHVLLTQAGVHHMKGLLKAYVRDPEHAPEISARLTAAYPDAQVLCLAADICRRELLVEIEGVCWAGSG